MSFQPLHHQQSQPPHPPHPQQQQLQYQQQQQQQQQFQQQQHQHYQQQHYQQQQHQSPQIPGQQQFAMNGMNGAAAAAAAAAGMPLPTPAGHQAELNYIYGMVEDLSRQLSENRRVTEEIITGLGRVRNKAKKNNLANDDIISSAVQEIGEQEDNLDHLVSLLSESLEKAKSSRDANYSLLNQYAHALALMLKQFHEYKAKHVADVTAWHRSYRAQLDEARRENSRLREQMWEMQAHARHANESLRDFRRRYDEDEARWNRRVDDKAVRQELRFWKRLAMPELEDDDPYWSDDDDIIDPAEKERLRELEHRAAQEQMADSQTEDSEGHQSLQESLMGGIAMQREDSMGQAVPMPPPRPLSAASTTGSTG
ncbi:hypothetical protein S7711_04770 [Stachybotrys chartarum IBT 7711]|uniref:Uncharacterized protein n=1 Tax=Stachybotrys chartarum (strain CBS 109288 / IBT 7711) TaxID=1280523 RepID=A0A084ASF9_STACB|nr:hypothetical protein S7711_04770 [Stachybotrys chartarum IBT 7711]KFA50032.1 hypothetical protein S40293_06830 [Stachybotrys chartarum IBT 40293]KFA73370.1 hypothetical protein S40288_09347 [Stachybotrys chartarum IBT 40288]